MNSSVAQPGSRTQSQNPPVSPAVKRTILVRLGVMDTGKGVYEGDLKQGVDSREFGRALSQMANDRLVTRWKRSTWYGSGWCITDAGRIWITSDIPTRIQLTPAPLMLPAPPPVLSLPAPAPVLALPAPSPRALFDHDLFTRLCAAPPGILEVGVTPRDGRFFVTWNGIPMLEGKCSMDYPERVTLQTPLSNRAFYAGKARRWSASYSFRLLSTEMKTHIQTVINRAAAYRSRQMIYLPAPLEVMKPCHA